MPIKKGKYTYEELLKLKRSEKPASEFWDTFDNELATRQRKILLKNSANTPASLESGFWSIIKKSAGYCCAAASCGAIVFYTTTSSQLAENPSIEENATPSFTVAETASSLNVEPTSEPQMVAQTTAFVEVPNESPAIAAAPVAIDQIDEPAVTSQPNTPTDSAVEPLFVVAQSFSLERESALRDIDIEAVADFKSKQRSPSSLADRYMNPLSDMGYQYTANIATKGSTLDRITALAADTDFLRNDNKWGLNLDKVSVNF